MCGFAGILTRDAAAGTPGFAAAIRRMTGLLERRGPDDEGFWSDAEGRLQLGFRRLAVLDLTPAAHQPMVAADGSSVIVFNGEIGNVEALKEELGQHGVTFRSRSDTEVLLAALTRWGVGALPKLNGMFAFAWYDRRACTLLLARDHAGIKPLYYFARPDGSGFAFASQYNTLLQTPWGEPGRVRGDVLRAYLRLQHVPTPYGLLEHTYQLDPGSYAIVHPDGRLEQRRWWRLPEHPEPEWRGSDAVDRLADALSAAVSRQRLADVPLGVLLSGGVDSPLVTAVTRQQSGPELKAFTIGNPGWSQDESPTAAAYARALDVTHRLHHVTAEDARGTIQDVMAAQHEPFGDFSILPMLMVSRLARADVTVALSGDGGDELFFGYERPISLLRNGSDFRWPWLMRRGLYALGRAGIGARRSGAVAFRSAGDYYFNVNCRMADADLRTLAPGLGPLPQDFDLYDSGAAHDTRSLADYSRRVEFYGQLQRGLKKVDMASMYHGLEVRVPLLDRQVVDVSLRIDPRDCMRNGLRKAVLRDLLGRYVPAGLMPTAKLGFAVPLGEWLRGALRPMVEDTLFGAPLYPDGVFDQRAIRRYWDDHVSGRRDLKWGLWTVLALQWWARSHAGAAGGVGK